MCTMVFVVFNCCLSSLDAFNAFDNAPDIVRKALSDPPGAWIEESKLQTPSTSQCHAVSYELTR